jgi:RNA polymerase sigma factor (sigma-70 family)
MLEPLEVDELVRAARAGDAAAWDALVDRYLPLVTAVIRRMRLSAADADDVNQTVWLRLVEHLDTLREPKALPGWLATTARNEGLRAIRRKARDLPVDPEGGVFDRGEQHDLDEAIVQDLRSHALREAMQELPENRRELLYLLLADPPLSYDEISARLGIPKGSIGPTRARALEQLRSSRALSGWLTDEPARQGGDRDAVLD